MEESLQKLYDQVNKEYRKAKDLTTTITEIDYTDKYVILSNADKSIKVNVSNSLIKIIAKNIENNIYARKSNYGRVRSKGNN